MIFVAFAIGLGNGVFCLWLWELTMLWRERGWFFLGWRGVDGWMEEFEAVEGRGRVCDEGCMVWGCCWMMIYGVLVVCSEQA